ncbi:YbhN family protein [Streptomyces cheonanensis]|uniref:YbhN family protein n=1 Tax=Streptomyces cheonanensis TaxID=312720 RepID=A0ABN2UR48_9ACTN
MTEGDRRGFDAGAVDDSRPPPRVGWPWWLLAAAVIIAALVLAASRRDELGQAFEQLSRVNPVKVSLALVCQAGAMWCLALVQRWLLLTGGLRMGRGSLISLILASNAVSGALPGGAAFSAAWLYRELHRRGASKALAAASLVIAGALSALGLIVVLAAGVLTTGARGPGAVLGRIGLVLALLALLVLLLSRSAAVRARVRGLWRRAADRYRWVREASEALRRLLVQARTIQPGLRPWLRPYAYAQLNWLLDAATLVASLWALGISVPWHGLLIAYGLTQIPGSLRLTPGGIGVVEASMAGLLVVYGLSAADALAATLLYRIWSYWLLQPIGWGCWLALSLHGRRREPPGPGA